MAQTIRPNSDVSVTSINVSSGSAAKYTYIDESVADDADFIYGNNNTATTARIGIAAPADTTGLVGTTATVTFRHRKQNAGAAVGTGSTSLITCSVYYGTTLIANDAQQTPTSTWTQRQFTFTVPVGINWATLELRFAQTAVSSRCVGISYADISVADPAHTSSVSVSVALASSAAVGSSNRGPSASTSLALSPSGGVGSSARNRVASSSFALTPDAVGNSGRTGVVSASLLLAPSVGSPVVGYSAGGAIALAIALAGDAVLGFDVGGAVEVAFVTEGDIDRGYEAGGEVAVEFATVGAASAGFSVGGAAVTTLATEGGVAVGVYGGGTATVTCTTEGDTAIAVSSSGAVAATIAVAGAYVAGLSYGEVIPQSFELRGDYRCAFSMGGAATVVFAVPGALADFTGPASVVFELACTTTISVTSGGGVEVLIDATGPDPDTGAHRNIRSERVLIRQPKNPPRSRVPEAACVYGSLAVKLA